MMKQSEAADILVVEDSTGDAELTLEALKARGLGGKVVHFLDGDGVLEFLGANTWSPESVAGSAPRLVLLDWNLGRVPGFEVLHQLKVRERTRPIPVVVFTGSYDEQEMLKSYRLGANSYVVKPTDPDRYLQLVGDIVHYWLEVNRPYR
jgi:two-component system response regulator